MSGKVVGAGQATHGAELPQRARPVAEAVGDQTRGPRGPRDAAGATDGGLGVGQGSLGLDVEQLGDHDEVLGDTFGVLLGQGASWLFTPRSTS